MHPDLGPAQILGQLAPLPGGLCAAQLLDLIGRHMTPAKILQCLNDETAQAPSRGHVARHRMPPLDFNSLKTHDTAGAIGQELDLGRHLFRKPLPIDLAQVARGTRSTELAWLWQNHQSTPRSPWQGIASPLQGEPDRLGQLNLCRQEVLEYRKIAITGETLRGCETEEESQERLEMLRNLMHQTGVSWIGGDLGYTNDPTERVVIRESEVAERPVLRLVLRVHLEQVAYPLIAQSIALLERFFTPTGIGLDNGGNGLAVVQELLTLDKYRPLSLEERLRGFDFGGMDHAGHARWARGQETDQGAHDQPHQRRRSRGSS